MLRMSVRTKLKSSPSPGAARCCRFIDSPGTASSVSCSGTLEFFFDVSKK